MPFSWLITINKTKRGYAYTPASLGSVAIADEIVFTNNDDRPHWPGLLDTTGKAPSPTTYFMKYQIAPHSSSTTWIPGVNGTVTYADSLDETPSRPTGTIVVAAPQAAEVK